MASGRKLGLVMLENDDVPVLPVIRQAQIIEELSALLPERVRGSGRGLSLLLVICQCMELSLIHI